MKLFKKRFAIILYGLFFLLVNGQVRSQCVLTLVDTENFEYTTNCPDLITGMTYHTMPKSYAVYSGSYSLYMNFVNNLPPGSLIYERPYSVCPNQTYQISAWFIETWNGQCNITVNLVDGSGIILDTWTGLIGNANWVNWTSNLVTPLSNTMSYRVISNYMAGSNDLSMDLIELSRCVLPEFDDGAIEVCESNNPINLYDSLDLVNGNIGSWTGPSATTGGYLGTFDPASLASGLYTYTAVGAGACPDSIATLTVLVNPAPSPSTIVDVPFCDGGTISLVDANLYDSWIWSTTETTEIINVSANGNYSVTVTDSIGCNGATNAIVTLPPSDVNVTLIPIPVACFGDSSGEINLTATGGTLPYSYEWSNGSVSEDPNNLATGNYSVTVTDDHNCQTLAQAEILQPDELQIILSGTDLTCHGDTDGSIQAHVTGGIVNYLYEWSNGPNTPGVHNLNSGYYMLTVTDYNGCTKSEGIAINEPDQINLYASSDQYICLGQATNIVSAPIGGTPPYNYFWNPGGYGTSSISISPEVSTEYCTYITDANNCISEVVCVSIFVSPALELDIEISQDTICRGDTIQILSNASGGNGGPYVYELAYGQIITNSHFIAPQNSGKIIVLAYDACGTPAARDTVKVYVSEAPNVSFVADNIEGCPPLNVQFTNILSDTTNKYLWDFDDSQYFNFSIEEHPQHLYRNPGEYDVTLEATNKVGCKAKITMNSLVHVWDKPIASFTVDHQSATIANPAFNFYNTSSGASDYYWHFEQEDHFDSILVEHPREQYFDSEGEHLISLIAENLEGCRDSAFMIINVEGIQTVYFPNAINPFSKIPENSIFKPIGTNLMSEHYYLSVYSRLGELLFETNNYETGWDGRSKGGNLVPSDSYVWIIKFKDLKGNLHQDSGFINVIY